MCAVNYTDTGWRGGYNIDWGAVKSFCYVKWHKKDSGKNSYCVIVVKLYYVIIINIIAGLFDYFSMYSISLTKGGNFF
jgi:hypothetical protein